MPIVVKKWGNSAAIRIPSSILKAAKISLEQAVEVHAEEGRIIIEPMRGEYDLSALIAGITSENRHHETDFGMPNGQEWL